jgi:uncharacterized ion transporter superfamily protein YfcC
MAGRVLPITCMLSYFACSYFNIVYHLDVQKNGVSVLLAKNERNKRNGKRRKEKNKCKRTKRIIIIVITILINFLIAGA